MILANPKIKHVHLIGVGGIGMSALAEILTRRGYRVTGSDIAENKLIAHLRNVGVEISIGHQEENVADADAIVYSSAINQDNPEFALAMQRELPMLRRGEMLAELMQANYGIAIAGTHGKTTTTSLTAQLLRQNDLDPTYVIGGVLCGDSSPAHLGSSDYFVAEADESDASFLYMRPTIAVVTNIEADHMDTYHGDMLQLTNSFLQFLNQIPDDGLAIVCYDDPIMRSIIPQLTCPILTYGFSEEADMRIINYRQKGLDTYFDVCDQKNQQSVSFEMRLPGKHNIANATAAICIAKFLSVPVVGIQKALTKFPGVGRRFYLHGEIQVNGGKALLFDDYGHHPSEITATLQAMREVWPQRRIVLAFQPHRYSRTRDLMEEFAQALSAADHLLLLDIYSAGEQQLPGISGELLYEKIISHGKITPRFIPSLEVLANELQNELQPDDVIVFQGAGSIGPFAEVVAQKMAVN